jgi:hypothetical protein
MKDDDSFRRKINKDKQSVSEICLAARASGSLPTTIRREKMIWIEKEIAKTSTKILDLFI